jgi:hypothetical protein
MTNCTRDALALGLSISRSHSTPVLPEQTAVVEFVVKNNPAFGRTVRAKFRLFSLSAIAIEAGLVSKFLNVISSEGPAGKMWICEGLPFKNSPELIKAPG